MIVAQKMLLLHLEATMNTFKFFLARLYYNIKLWHHEQVYFIPPSIKEDRRMMTEALQFFRVKYHLSEFNDNEFIIW